MIKIVSFDFDGVIIDSAHECFIITLKAMEEMGETFRDSRQLEEQYNQLRPFIKIADDFYAIMKIIEEKNFSVKTQEEFDEYLRKYDKKCKEFEKHFYGLRAGYIKKHTKKWLGLNRTYPGIINTIKKLAKNYRILIVTAKDTESSLTLLKSIGLDIDENCVFGKEFSKAKADQIKYVKDKFSVEFSEILLLEDSLKQIKSMNNLGIRLVMAAWGYNNEAQRKEAKHLAVPVIAKPQELDEIIKRPTQ